jgi:hypothetical protein
MRGDLGIRVVRQVFELWHVDAEWSVWDHDGFSWWGHDYRQRISVDAGTEDLDATVYRLSAVTDFFREVPAEDENYIRWLGVLNRFASTYGLVIDETLRTVKATTFVYLHADNASWLVHLFAALAILQPIDAQIRAARLQADLRCIADQSSHPSRGQRPLQDDMLNLIETHYRPAGASQSRWIGSAEFAEAQKVLTRGGVLANAGTTGLSAEVAFDQDTALITARTDTPHPQLGHGLFLMLQLPKSSHEAAVAALAAELNRAEAGLFTRAHFIGSWCAGPVGDHFLPTFVCFIPNALHRPGLITHLLPVMVIRARWAAYFFGNRALGAHHSKQATVAEADALRIPRSIWVIRMPASTMTEAAKRADEIMRRIRAFPEDSDVDKAKAEKEYEAIQRRVIRALVTHAEGKPPLVVQLIAAAIGRPDFDTSPIDPEAYRVEQGRITPIINILMKDRADENFIDLTPQEREAVLSALGADLNQEAIAGSLFKTIEPDEAVPARGGEGDSTKGPDVRRGRRSRDLESDRRDWERAREQVREIAAERDLDSAAFADAWDARLDRFAARHPQK